MTFLIGRLTRIAPGRALAAVAALALALAAGYGLARLTDRKPAAAAAIASPPQAERHEEDSEEGVVPLTPVQSRAAGILIQPVGQGGGGEIRLSGRVEAMAGARAPVTSIIEGRIERLLVAAGQRVRAGQAIAVLISADAATLRAEVDAASAAAEAAVATHARDAALHAKGWTAAQRVETSRAQMLSAQASARAARARLAAAGSPDAAGRFRITAPIDGVVVGLQGAPGAFAEEGAPIAEIADPDRVELVFQAPAGPQPRAGASIRVESAGAAFDAVVVSVAPNAQPNGAAIVRARAAAGQMPPAGSAVTGLIATGADQFSSLTVPSEAVQTVEGRSVVFVATPGGFRAVPVLVGRAAAGRSEILGGLTVGQRIAAANAFLLKAELAKGEAGHGH